MTGEAAPLAGLRVVELAVVIAGPSAGALLGDLGAEVTKIEPPEGDPQRGNATIAYFDLDNRSKRSIALDLKTGGGLAVALALLDRADVFVTNLRASALARLGLDHDSLATRNPRLVYGLVTGYGTQGPFADKPGYDIGAYWSRAGVAAALVGPGNEPPVSRPGMGDHTAALALVAGILAALYQREHTGTGQLVTTSLLRSGMYTISSDYAAEMNGANPEYGLRRSQYNPLLACYQAGDGKWFWLLGLQTFRHWPNVLRAVGREELLEDERFTSHRRLLRFRDDVVAILDAAFAERPMAQWAEIFTREDVWWDPVQDLPAALEDPAILASGGLRPMGDGRTVSPPFDVGSYRPPDATAAPETGQHTEEILLELGYDWPGIVDLKDAGAIP